MNWMHRVSNLLRKIPSIVTIYLIRGYRVLLAPLMPTTCKYFPSCSHYAEQAIARHGFTTGARLGMLRILGCHPFAAGGYDPVPPEDKDFG